MNNIFKKTVLSICVLLVSAVSAGAFPNTLAGIDIQENDKGGLNIVLNIEGKAEVKKNTASSDMLNLIVSPAVSADNAEIIYDNNSRIKNVVIQKKNADNAMIIIEGRNVSDAEIFVKDAVSGISAPVRSGTAFFDAASGITAFTAGAIFLFMLIFNALKPKKKKAYKSLKDENLILKLNKRTVQNSNNAGYKSIGRVSEPEDFIISRYLEDQRQRKAG